MSPVLLREKKPVEGVVIYGNAVVSASFRFQIDVDVNRTGENYLLQCNRLKRKLSDVDVNQVGIGNQLEGGRYVTESYNDMHLYPDKVKDVERNLTKVTSSDIDVGKDLWKQLKRVSIPTFTGNKRQYESWRAAFNACIDRAPATAEYKLLQLRQHEQTREKIWWKKEASSIIH